MHNKRPLDSAPYQGAGGYPGGGGPGAEMKRSRADQQMGGGGGGGGGMYGEPQQLAGIVLCRQEPFVLEGNPGKGSAICHA